MSFYAGDHVKIIKVPEGDEDLLGTIGVVTGRAFLTDYTVVLDEPIARIEDGLLYVFDNELELL